jgi:FkbM family methyltransferase
MLFISYALNFEDVMLWRALRQVKGGFYIDVGAAWPSRESVTRAFYDRGWSGINVEPNPELHRQLQESRSRDKNLRLAVSSHEGILPLNIFHDTGFSTLNDRIAETHWRGGRRLERQEVQVTTLAALWQENVPAGQEVHFLKVDVEGLEEAVLSGNHWATNRPWVVVVEATVPLSQIESHENWEPILLATNYQFAYADGVNRFYVAKEHEELLSAFKYPPNAFDGFISYGQAKAEIRAQQAEARAWRPDAQARLAAAHENGFSRRVTWRLWISTLFRVISLLLRKREQRE